MGILVQCDICGFKESTKLYRNTTERDGITSFIVYFIKNKTKWRKREGKIFCSNECEIQFLREEEIND